MKSPSVLLPGINHMNALNHNALTCSAVPIPPWERSLQTVEAQPYFNVSQASLVLEGIVGDMQRGSVRAIEPNGTREQMIVAPDTGFLVNDLVFDNQGGFYFTDSRGNSADPQGGVFYVSPNVGSIHAILPGLAVGNGIAIDHGRPVWFSGYLSVHRAGARRGPCRQRRQCICGHLRPGPRHGLQPQRTAYWANCAA